jgi:hypothetical protein
LVNNTVYQVGQWISGEEISFNMTTFDAGSYIIFLEVYDESGNYATWQLIITIKIIETIKPNVNIEEVLREGDINQISGLWLTHESEVKEGSVGLQLSENSQILKELQITTSTDGHFSANLDYSDIPIGVYILSIEFSKYGYQNHTLFFEVKIISHQLIVEVTTSSQFKQNEEFQIFVTVFYAEFTNNDSLGLNSIIRKSGPVSGILLTLVLSVEFIDEESVISNSLTTNAEGIVIWTLSRAETRSIYNILGMDVIIEDTDFFSGISHSLPAEYFPSVETLPPIGIPFITSYLDLALLILTLLASLALISLVVLFARKRSQKQKLILSRASQEIQALNSIRTILFQNLGGIPLLKLDIRQLSVDTTLIGGMATALTSFMQEIISSERNGFEVFERHNLSITIHSLEKSLFIVISETTLPNSIQKSIKNLHTELEKEYNDMLERQTSVVIDLGEFMRMSNDFGFNIGLLNTLKITSQIKEKLKNIKIKSGDKEKILKLEEFKRKHTHGQIRLKNLLEYYKSIGLNIELASKIILLAYNNKILIDMDQDNFATEIIDLLEEGQESNNYDVETFALPEPEMDRTN